MALSAPQWLVWLFHAHSAVEVIVVSLVFGALYAAAALGFELRMPSERLRLAATIVLVLNALMVGVAGWMRLRGLGHGDLAIMWLGLLSACHLTGGIAAIALARASRRTSGCRALRSPSCSRTWRSRSPSTARAGPRASRPVASCLPR